MSLPGVTTAPTELTFSLLTTPRNGASNASRTYELGREVLVTSTRPGQVSRVSVAVAIDEAALGEKPQEEIAKIEELVAAAVGANPARGDTVAVMTRAFEPLEMEEMQFWETPWFATILRNVVALLSVLLVLLLAVRPLLKAVTRKLDPASAADDDADDADEDETDEDEADEDDDESEEAARRGLPLAMLEPPSPEELSQQIEAARRIAREQPEDAVQALRRMLREQPPTADEDSEEESEAA